MGVERGILSEKSVLRRSTPDQQRGEEGVEAVAERQRPEIAVVVDEIGP